MNEKIYLKLKSGARAPHTRRLGTVRIHAANHEPQAFEGKAARLALSTGDFELASPEEAENALPADFPMRRELAAAGYSNVRSVQAATDEDLLKAKGVGVKSLEAIREIAPFLAPPAADQTPEGDQE